MWLLQALGPSWWIYAWAVVVAFGIFVTFIAPTVIMPLFTGPEFSPALDTLTERGYRLAVCTNKLEWLSVRLLDAIGEALATISARQ